MCALVTLKPIIHYDAKPLALGPRIGLDSQHDNFALPIPLTGVVVGGLIKGVIRLPPLPPVRAGGHGVV